MIKIILITLLLAGSVNTFAQQNENRSRQADVVSGQRFTAAYFRTYLELNQPDSALQYLEPDYLQANPTLVQQIRDAAKIISSIKEKCLPQDVYAAVGHLDTVNRISLYYTIPPTPKYALDLFFKAGQKDAKISQIIFKTEKQLAAERKKRMEKESETPPSVPPPIR